MTVLNFSDVISYETVTMMDLVSLDISYLNPVSFHKNSYQVKGR